MSHPKIIGGKKTREPTALLFQNNETLEECNELSLQYNYMKSWTCQYSKTMSQGTCQIVNIAKYVSRNMSIQQNMSQGTCIYDGDLEHAKQCYK